MISACKNVINPVRRMVPPTKNNFGTIFSCWAILNNNKIYNREFVLRDSSFIHAVNVTGIDRDLVVLRLLRENIGPLVTFC